MSRGMGGVVPDGNYETDGAHPCVGEGKLSIYHLYALPYADQSAKLRRISTHKRRHRQSTFFANGTLHNDEAFF